MSINQRTKLGAYVALLAVLAFAFFARSTVQADHVAPVPGPEAGKTTALDTADASTTFVSGVPLPLLATLAGMPESGMAWGAVTRLGLAAGAEIPVLIGGGPTVYVVEAGELAVRSDGTARIARAGAGSFQTQQLVLRGDEVALGVGDQVVIDAGVSYGLRNAGTTTATALAAAILPDSALVAPTFTNDGLTPEPSLSVAMFLSMPDWEDAPAWPQGVTVKPLAAQEIGTGAAVALADEVRSSSPPPSRPGGPHVEP